MTIILSTASAIIYLIADIYKIRYTLIRYKTTPIATTATNVLRKRHPAFRESQSRIRSSLMCTGTGLTLQSVSLQCSRMDRVYFSVHLMLDLTM